MGEDRIPPEMSRHTVAQAADMLGISTGAVRNRLSRGTLRSVKEAGTVYVLLPADMLRDADRDVGGTPGGISGETPRPDHEAREATDDSREQVRYLRDQLRREQDARIEERRRHDMIIAQLPAANTEQARTIRAIGAATSEAAEESAEHAETVEEAPEPQPASAAPQTAAQRRLWWRRIFGG